MNTNLVDLPLFAGLPVSLPLLRAIVTTAPQKPVSTSSTTKSRTASISTVVGRRRACDGRSPGSFLCALTTARG